MPNFDIVSYLMGKSNGGGGSSGGGNAYAYLSPPTSNIGKDGEYYFELSDKGYREGANIEPYSSASVLSGGWEFQVNSAIKICGARAQARSNGTGIVKLADSNGNVLAEKSIKLEQNEWNYLLFDSSIPLTVGNNYIIMLFCSSAILNYTRIREITDPSITYVRGRYGGLPGTQEGSVYYGVDILIEEGLSPPFPIKTQYYKSGGVWRPVNSSGSDAVIENNLLRTDSASTNNQLIDYSNSGAQIDNNLISFI